MGGTGDIGGGSCILDFKVWKKGGNEGNTHTKWNCNDEDGQQRKYRIVRQNKPGDWITLEPGDVLQIRWD